MVWAVGRLRLAIDSSFVREVERELTNTIRVNPSSEPNEVIADFLLNLALRTISLNTVADSRELLRISINNAILANLSPEEVAQWLGIEYRPLEGVNTPSGSIGRFALDSGGRVNLTSALTELSNTPFFSYPAGESVVILGRTADKLRDTESGQQTYYWLYVYRDSPDVGYHQYSWVRADTLVINGQPLDDAAIQSVPVIESGFSRTYPRR